MKVFRIEIDQDGFRAWRGNEILATSSSGTDLLKVFTEIARVGESDIVVTFSPKELLEEVWTTLMEVCELSDDPNYTLQTEKIRDLMKRVNSAKEQL